MCFYADSDFADMAVGAISTLLSCTPCIYIGLLTLDPNDEIEILQQLSPFETSRLIRRPVSASPHFSKWNPTQYKLDIVRFLDSGSFDYIFWMDSGNLFIIYLCVIILLLFIC